MIDKAIKLSNSIDVIAVDQQRQLLLYTNSAWNKRTVTSGCCKPPTACNFTYLNETYWTKPPVSGAGARDSSMDPDCDSWSNDQSELCYGCQSCKAARPASWGTSRRYGRRSPCSTPPSSRSSPSSTGSAAARSGTTGGTTTPALGNEEQAEFCMSRCGVSEIRIPAECKELYEFSIALPSCFSGLQFHTYKH
ncbi:hypothetical protein BRADI_3g19202v3 [Brachypodium distachyon]|uniref:Uncharacterized protein n=1 Tax=Brachypodium distachyon TaxID=15368 RepID=I1I2D5_BRADI|nr:hypothetical protein BRADI_3g19202v3 [Brachypodium distachyon]